MDPELECVGCGHLAAEHEADADGDFVGGCLHMDEAVSCSCSAMDTGDGSDVSGDPAQQQPAPAGDATAGLQKIVTMATEVTGGSGAVGGTDANSIATQLDDAVDSLTTGDATADALIQAADNSIDLFLAKRGVTDPDEDITVGSGNDDDPADLANACKASLEAAAQIVTDNDDLNSAVSLAGDLVSALGTGMTAASDPVEDDAPPAGDPIAFEMPIMVLEGVDTGDGRYIDKSVLTWRELPLPLMGTLKTTYGHEDAELIGRIDSIERVDASSMTNPKTGQPYGEGVTALAGKGVFTSLENAEQMATLVREGFIRGISVDLGDVESVVEFVDKDGNVVEDPDDGGLLDFLFFAADTGEDEADSSDENEENEDGEDDVTLRERMTAARLMGATLLPFPAFEGAFIRLADGTESPREPVEPAVAASGIRVMDDPYERTCRPCEEGLVASAAAPMYPPRAWFEMDEPDELTPLTITDDGQVFGHIAGWQSCHTGVTGKCVLAPKSRTNYANFHKGALKTAEGDIIAVGALTMGTGHAELTLDAHAAMAHYDNTGTVAAMGTARDGRHGIWFCGALEPDMDELRIRKFRGSALSGDWRPLGRGLEMIAALAVNTPGFLVPRARVASGAPSALVAAGVVQQPKQKTASKTDEVVAALQNDVNSVLTYVMEREASTIRDKFKAGLTKQLDKSADALRARVHKQ